MGFLFGKNKKEQAGLFIDRNSYQYISLVNRNDHFDVVQYASGALSENLNIDYDSDEESKINREKIFKNIIADIGEIKVPVNIAIPPTDSLLRIVPLPEMGLAEARMAFRYDYERYFPFPVDEAVFDIAPIVYPLPSGSEEKRFLVASTRKNLINEIMNAASDQGIEVDSIEPAQIALERAITPKISPCDAAVYVYTGKRNSVIILSWKGNGIFYRSIMGGLENAHELEINDVSNDTLEDVPEHSFVKEVRSSMQFALSQIRGFEPSVMFLFGSGATDRLCELMKEAIDIPSVIITDPIGIHGIEFNADKIPAGSWDIPIGLAMRQS